MKRAAYLIAFIMIMDSCTVNPDNMVPVDAFPAIYPDYIDVTVPSTIAPLDFDVDNAEKVLSIVSFKGREIRAYGNSANFNIGKWHELLKLAKGDSISVTACAKINGVWQRYKPFNIHVSQDSIDFSIVYRRIGPGYEVFSSLGIYQRDLSNFNETCLIGSNNLDGCVNCHSFNRTKPEDLSLHVRGANGATLIRKNGVTAAYDMRTDYTLGGCVYPYWHPNGRFIAYSTNISRQGFHQQANKVLEVYDLKSDIEVFDTETNEIITAPEVKVDGVLENMPVFSADGRSIYYTAATEKDISEFYNEVRYNLCRIDFDPETGDLGHKTDTIIFAEALGKSVSFPKPSYDGRFLIYQLADYGCFGAWHHESDLWLLDLRTMEQRPLDGVNSSDAESTHSWSSNSHWFVFGSRRDDGLFTRAYICHIDENGVCGKPFMLPQRSPRSFYLDMSHSYNIPEFVSGPVNFGTRKTVDLYNSNQRVSAGFRWSK